MEWIEILGLLVMMLAFLLPAIGRARKKRRLSDEEKQELAKQERREYEQFLVSLGAVEEVEALRQREREIEPPEPQPEPVLEPAPPAPPEPPPKRDSYSPKAKGASAIHKLLEEEGSKQAMVLLYEVLSRPVGERRD